MALNKSKNKKKKFDVYDNRRTAFYIITFLFGIVSMVILYPKTMISFKNTLVLILLFLFVDVIVIQLKTKIKNLQTYIGLCLTVLLAQLSILLWLNLIPIDSHTEKHKIVGSKSFDSGNILQLENDAFGDFFFVRYQNRDTRKQDTITYYFKDGLLGFNVLDSIK
jgi:hypothetical protein